jgi:hypothetical protein
MCLVELILPLRNRNPCFWCVDGMAWSPCDVGLCLIISDFMVLISVDKLWIERLFSCVGHILVVWCLELFDGFGILDNRVLYCSVLEVRFSKIIKYDSLV